jgi:hypothetical protein
LGKGRLTGSAPGGGVVDFGQGIYRLEGFGEVPGDDGHGMAGLLEEEGAAEADDAGAGVVLVLLWLFR